MRVSPFWLPALIAVSIAIAALILARSASYSDAISAEGSRYGHLDGLRGYLALCVFATHLFSNYYWHLTGEWGYPDSIVYRLASSAPVSVFFMITAFLFWGKVVRSRCNIDWRSLFRSRFYRLAPLYLACVPALLFFVGAETKWSRQVSWTTLAVSIVRWMGLGVLGATAVNGYSQTFALHPAIWTLRYEWLFYFCLPIIGIMFRPIRAIVLGTVISVAAIYFDKPVVLNFVLGAWAVYLVGDKRLGFLSGKIAGIAVCASIVVMAYFDLYEPGVAHSLLLFPLFLAVCQGNSLFGTLSSRPALVLGLISYSVYLTHMLLIHSVLFSIEAYVPLDTKMVFVIVVPIIGIVVVLVSALTFWYIERPWLKRSAASRR